MISMPFLKLVNFNTNYKTKGLEEKQGPAPSGSKKNSMQSGTVQPEADQVADETVLIQISALNLHTECYPSLDTVLVFAVKSRKLVSEERELISCLFTLTCQFDRNKGQSQKADREENKNAKRDDMRDRR